MYKGISALVISLFLFSCATNDDTNKSFENEAKVKIDFGGKSETHVIKYNRTEYSNYEDIPSEHKSELTDKFNLLMKGMTRQEVQEIMGVPHKKRSISDIWFLNEKDNYRSQLWISYDFDGKATITALWQDADTGVNYRPFK